MSACCSGFPNCIHKAIENTAYWQRKYDDLFKENTALKEEVDKLKQVIDNGDALDALTIVHEKNNELIDKVKVLREALENLKRQNHHTIEEEMWRIDEALEATKGDA